MKTIKNKLISVKIFSILLLFVFLVGLQTPVFAVYPPKEGRDATQLEKTELYQKVETVKGNIGSDNILTENLKKSIKKGEYINVSRDETPPAYDENMETKYLKHMEVLVNATTGELYWKNKGIPSANVITTPPGKKHLYIMTREQKIYIHEENHETEENQFGHPAFLSEGKAVPAGDASISVAGAGEITVDQGKIVSISNVSGHYRPSPDVSPQILAVLTLGKTDDQTATYLKTINISLFLSVEIAYKKEP